ncbi:hypothetical protein ACQSI4_002658 [Enterobacter hormaechei]
MKPVEGPLLLFTLMLSAVTLSGCGDKNEREFIRGCKSGGGTTAVCGCIRDDLKRNIRTGSWRK